MPQCLLRTWHLMPRRSKRLHPNKNMLATGTNIDNRLAQPFGSASDSQARDHAIDVDKLAAVRRWLDAGLQSLSRVTCEAQRSEPEVGHQRHVPWPMHRYNHHFAALTTRCSKSGTGVQPSSRSARLGSETRQGTSWSLVWTASNCMR